MGPRIVYAFPLVEPVLMKTAAIIAFFRLIRWQNLVFIALTQCLFYFCIIIPSFYDALPVHENILRPPEFALLCLSSVLIAAAGYIINDYFDLPIDRINRAQRVLVEKIIKQRWSI